MNYNVLFLGEEKGKGEIYADLISFANISSKQEEIYKSVSNLESSYLDFKQVKVDDLNLSFWYAFNSKEQIGKCFLQNMNVILVTFSVENAQSFDLAQLILNDITTILGGKENISRLLFVLFGVYEFSQKKRDRVVSISDVQNFITLKDDERVNIIYYEKEDGEDYVADLFGVILSFANDGNRGNERYSSPLKGDMSKDLFKSKSLSMDNLVLSLSSHFSPPPWKEDKDILNCEGCLNNFTLFRRKHHCRGCGAVFCDSCSSFRAAINFEGDVEKTISRVCKHCYDLFHPPIVK